jgi:hypothetical protein
VKDNNTYHSLNILHIAQLRNNIEKQVPAKPIWFSHLNEVIAELRSLPRPYLDRAAVQELLGVGRRRAQQIMAPCVSVRVGSSAVVDRDALITHLQRISSGEEAYYEAQRQRRFAATLERMHRELVEGRRVLVAAPVAIVNTELDGLPAGVQLDRGHISIDFDEPREALEKLYALAMAIGNDMGGFERRVGQKP